MVSPARLIVHRKAANPLTSAPPSTQPVEITENKLKKWTLSLIRNMSATEFERNMQNAEFVKAVDALFNGM